MKIEFNTSHVPEPASGQVAAPKPATTSTSDSVSLQDNTLLNDKLHEVPAVRQDRVAQAQALVADGSYPPEQTLRAISVLLAMHLGQE